MEVLRELVRAYPLGTLIVLTSNGMEANHIPFEFDPEPTPFGTLRGHVARANPVWQEFSRDVETLVIFQGPSAYISPSWYPSKGEHGRVVPTWNYAIVHAYGSLRAIEDRVWLRSFIEKLTNRHEAGRDNRWQVTDAPPDYIEKMLGAIVGIEILLTRLVGKWKVSQNRSAKDRDGVIKGLLQERHASAAAVADLVRGSKSG